MHNPAEESPGLVTSGKFQIATETSLYLVDLDAGAVTRVPDAGAGSVDGSPLPVSALRRDHESIPLIGIQEPALGEPLVLLLNVRGDGIPTFRRTTYVRSITRLDTPPEGQVADDAEAG
jgi:hypothetical protein